MSRNSSIDKTNTKVVDHHDRASDISSSDLSIALCDTFSYGDNGFKGVIRFPYVFGAALLASVGGFSFGYDQGVISLILTMDRFRKQYPETMPGTPGYGFHTGFMTAMLELGAFVGCLFFPKLADRIFRKWGLTVAVVIFFIGAIIQTVSPDYTILVVGRTIEGVGVGTLAMGAPLYITEIAPPKHRGILLALEELAIVVGAVVSFWIAYGTRPRWLAMRGRQEECLASLVKLRRLSRDDYRVQLEWKGILAEVQFQREVLKREHPNDSGISLEIKEWADLFQRKCIKRSIVAIGLPFFA
ncbi:MAG: hypothetical protein M1834_003228 [Cirrosporium novae-zelandiae]|nr:MAG: hypothetical protein M1834_003228 [Cirrosporium novae-zelandiae]